MRNPFTPWSTNSVGATDIGYDLRYTVTHGFQNGHAERFHPLVRMRKIQHELSALIERVNIALSRDALGKLAGNDRSLKEGGNF